MLTWSLGWTGSLAAEDPAHQLDGPVGDDLVGVHVGLRAGAGLPDEEREVVVEAAPGDLLRGAHDEGADARVQAPGRQVDLRARQLEESHGVHDLDGHALGARVADGEVVQGALCLGTPVAVGGHLDGTHRIGLDAHRGGGRSAHGVTVAPAAPPRAITAVVVECRACRHAPPFGPASFCSTQPSS